MAPTPPNPGEPDRTWLDHRDHSRKTHLSRRPSLRERERDALLRDWYGDDLAVEEKLAHRSRARPVAEFVPKVLAHFDAGPMMLLGDLQVRWAELVGADVARQSRPAGVQGNRLVIEVEDSSWLYVLDRMHKKQIQERVVRHTAGRVTSIQFKVLGLQPPAAGSYRRRPPGGAKVEG
jgi:hypothetical protein